MAIIQPSSTQPERRGPVTKRPKDESTFTRNLRYEIASEEGRVLLGSWGTAVGLGLIWLLLVWLGPRGTKPSLLREDEVTTIQLKPEDELLQTPPAPTPPTATVAPAASVPSPGPVNRPAGRRTPDKGTPKPGAAGSRTEQNTAGAIGSAFGTGSGSGSGGNVGDVSNVLRGVAISGGSGGTGGGLGGSGGGGTGGKTVLGNGQGGEGSRTPGRGGIGGGTGTGGGGGGGIGGVGAGGGITRTAVRVSTPRAIDVPDVGGPGRDMSDLGTFVRSRESQLRFCYSEYGLKANPRLAGTINVAISLAASGTVTGANITSRSWGGAGASAAESCITGKVRSWKFPAGSAGTYGFPFNFTPSGA